MQLDPIGPEHYDGLLPMFADEQELAGPGLLTDFARERIRAGLARARDRHDRADWAILRRCDGTVLGEAVLFQLDEANQSMQYRISLVDRIVRGRGYGTEATRLVRDFAFTALGLHRMWLEVNAFNTAAITAYAKVGFRLEGVRREAIWHERRWWDVHEMALIESDPRP